MNDLGSWASDTDETRQLRERMVAGLVQAGDITDERWRQVFATVPRHALVPRYYRPDNYQEINATTVIDHSVWLRSVYSDETLITQKTARTVTSSGTMPGLVALMLRALDIRDRHRVFQVGTGTGYTAGLLCERVGSQRVTTVDIDSALVRVAASRLSSMGYYPTVVTGNGADGYLLNAPYDRFLATCALRRISSTWLAQAASGARIVAPVAKGLVTLDVRDANHAVGYFLAEGGYFMPLRDGVDDSTAPVTDRAEATTQNHSRRTALGPRDTFYQQHVRFLLTVALPEVSIGQHGPSLDDLIIADHTGSSARLGSTEHGSFLVTETGPRALWADVERVHCLWNACQQPRRERFGLSIAHERQWIWLDSPEGQHTWDLPASASDTR
ncbi:MAG: methyltransferase domain-containing protein [Pseudonocardiaceae bacterium]